MAPGSEIPSFDSGVAVADDIAPDFDEMVGADCKDVDDAESESGGVVEAAEVGLAEASALSGESVPVDFSEPNRSLRLDMVSRPFSVSFSLVSPSGLDPGSGWAEVPPQPRLNTDSDATIARASQFLIALSFL